MYITYPFPGCSKQACDPLKPENIKRLFLLIQDEERFAQLLDKKIINLVGTIEFAPEYRIRFDRQWIHFFRNFDGNIYILEVLI